MHRDVSCAEDPKREFAQRWQVPPQMSRWRLLQPANQPPIRSWWVAIHIREDATEENLAGNAMMLRLLRPLETSNLWFWYLNVYLERKKHNKINRQNKQKTKLLMSFSLMNIVRRYLPKLGPLSDVLTKHLQPRAPKTISIPLRKERHPIKTATV